MAIWEKSAISDAIASIVIGFILAAMAIFLAFESKSLLVGETANRRIVAGVRQLVQEHPAVEEMRNPLTMHFGPDDVLLNLDVQFQPDLRAAELVGVIDELEEQIHDQYPSVRRIFIEVEGLKGYGKSPKPD